MAQSHWWEWNWCWILLNTVQLCAIQRCNDVVGRVGFDICWIVSWWLCFHFQNDADFTICWRVVYWKSRSCIDESRSDVWRALFTFNIVLILYSRVSDNAALTSLDASALTTASKYVVDRLEMTLKLTIGGAQCFVSGKWSRWRAQCWWIYWLCCMLCSIVSGNAMLTSLNVSKLTTVSRWNCLQCIFCLKRAFNLTIYLAQWFVSGWVGNCKLFNVFIAPTTICTVKWAAMPHWRRLMRRRWRPWRGECCQQSIIGNDVVLTMLSVGVQ